METQTETPEVGPAPPPGPLVRPQEGRWLAGVAAGVADRLGIPHWVARLLFFLASAGGGIGLFLYLAGWLLIPAEGEAESLGHRLARRIEGTRAWFGIGLVVLAGAIVLNMLPFVDASLLIPTVLFVIGILLYRGELPRWFEGGAIPPTPGGEGGGTPPPPAAVPAPTPSRPMRPPQPPSPLGQLTIGVALLATGGLLIADRLSPLVDAGWRHYLALAMAILGLGLLVGAVWGRARWLIGLGIMIVPFLVASSVWEFSDLQINETFRPETFDDLATTLERGTGSLTIDLTRLPWDGQVYELDAALGVGEIILIIPQNVAMDLRTQVGIGLIQGGGGFGIDQELTWEGEDGAMVLDVQVGIGQIQIETSEVSDEAGAQTTDTGDLFVKVEHEEGLDDSYVTMDGSIDLDLSAVELTGDRFIALETLAGSIRVVVPKDVSYRIRAHSDLGNISLFGEDVLPSGTVRSDSILATGPVLELEIYTSEGEIVVLMEGDRS